MSATPLEQAAKDLASRESLWVGRERIEKNLMTFARLIMDISAAARVPCAASPADPELKMAACVWCGWRSKQETCPHCKRERDSGIKIVLPIPPRATGEGVRDEQAATIQSEGAQAHDSARQSNLSTDLSGRPSDISASQVRANQDDAPVAVSLGLPEALAAFIDVYDVVFDEDDVVMLQAVLARLRGEATVRQDGD